MDEGYRRQSARRAAGASAQPLSSAPLAESAVVPNRSTRVMPVGSTTADYPLGTKTIVKRGGTYTPLVRFLNFTIFISFIIFVLDELPRNAFSSSHSSSSPLLSPSPCSLWTCPGWRCHRCSATWRSSTSMHRRTRRSMNLSSLPRATSPDTRTCASLRSWRAFSSPTTRRGVRCKSPSTSPKEQPTTPPDIRISSSADDSILSLTRYA